MVQSRENPGEKRKSARERAVERIDVRAELALFEAAIEKLKTEYEQYFIGILPFPPNKLHKQADQQLRNLMKAPFKNSEMKYRMRMLENRFRSYNTYWQRTLREKEEGTYHKDVFKANLRERHAKEDAMASTRKGKTEKSLQALFNSYKGALEKETGKKHNIDFNAFKKSISKRAKEYKQSHGNKRLTFKVVVKNGKVTVQAKEKK